MRFLLFGGARVEADDGGPLRLGKKLQQLLGLLLLRVNHDVPADVLATHLWGENQPADRHNSVQEIVCRLRAALNDSSARRVVVTAPDGYRLTAGPDAVDIIIFRRLAAAGLAVEESEPALAELLLTQAVKCSDGDLPDLADGALADEVYELHRLRREANEGMARLGSAGGAPRRPRWLAGSQPVGLFVRLAELPQLVLADVINEVSRVGGKIARLSGGLLVATVPGVTAALHVVGRLFEHLPGDPEVILGGAVDQLAEPDVGGPEPGVQLATRAAPGEFLLTAVIQRAAAAARVVARLDPADDGLWRMGRSPSEGPSYSGGARLASPLIGRDGDVAEVARMLASSKLVTLRGAGGIGKTRLAADVVGHIAADYADGASVIDLADADRHGGLLPAIAGALGFVSEPYRPLVETVLDRLRDRHLLLMLDNCEAFPEEVRSFVDVVGQRCTGVTVLATCRSALGSGNEVTYAVNPLGQDDAMTLLLLLGTAETEDTRGALIDDAARQLCGLLDGMPLAIECAASVARAFGLEATARLMGALPDGAVLPAIDAAHGGLGRHHSVERSLMASYRRLGREDAEFFERLSSLRGSWNADDAVAALPNGATTDLPIALRRLEEASLLRREGRDRWRMLEPVRQLAATLLLRRGEQAAQAERHALHFVALAERAAVGLRGPDEGQWFARLTDAHPNLNGALTYCVAARAAGPALRLTASLWWYWAATGRFLEGAAALERALTLGGDVDPKLRASARVAFGHLSWWAGDPHRAESVCQGTLDLLQMCDGSDPEVMWLEAWSRMGLAAARMWGGGSRELPTIQIEAAARLLTSIGDDSGLGIAYDIHSSLAWHWGDDGLADAKGRQALAAFEAGSHQTMIAQGRRVAGLAAALVGDVAGGRCLVESGIMLSEHLGDVGGMPLGLCTLGLVEVLDGRPERAAAAFARSLRINREAGQVWPAVLAVSFAGERAVFRGRPADGIRLLATAGTLTERTGIGLPPRERARVDEARRCARDLLGDRELASAEEEGRELGVAAAMVLAIEVLDSS